jgi:hypothetical protein
MILLHRFICRHEHKLMTHKIAGQADFHNMIILTDRSERDSTQGGSSKCAFAPAEGEYRGMDDESSVRR